MPTFTMTFADAIEATGGTLAYFNGRTILTGGNIGLEHYPIFDEKHRSVLNSHIVDAYLNDEIAHETVSIFRLRLSAHMNLHMPLFNKRYELALRDVDPLKTMDVRTQAKQKGREKGQADSESNAEGDNEAGSRSVYSDTPGSMLAGDADYATNASDANNFSTSKSTGKDQSKTQGESENESESHTEGYNGSPSDILARAQSNLLNVDQLVVGSLQHLFMSIMGNHDEYPVRGY